MYELISKKIHEVFGEFSKPSIGAIKPALIKLEKLGYIKSGRTFSEGGKMTGHYSITTEGKKAFKNMLLEELSENPVQLKQNSAIKIIACGLLSKDIQTIVLDSVSRQIELQRLDAERKLEKYRNLNTYQRILVDNLVMENNNYLKLIEKLKKCLQ